MWKTNKQAIQFLNGFKNTTQKFYQKKYVIINEYNSINNEIQKWKHQTRSLKLLHHDWFGQTKGIHLIDLTFVECSGIENINNMYNRNDKEPERLMPKKKNKDVNDQI